MSPISVSVGQVERIKKRLYRLPQAMAIRVQTSYCQSLINNTSPLDFHRDEDK